MAGSISERSRRAVGRTFPSFLAGKPVQHSFAKGQLFTSFFTACCELVQLAGDFLFDTFESGAFCINPKKGKNHAEACKGRQQHCLVLIQFHLQGKQSVCNNQSKYHKKAGNQWYACKEQHQQNSSDHPPQTGHCFHFHRFLPTSLVSFSKPAGCLLTLYLCSVPATRNEDQKLD